jgi:hypothetical protein
MDKIPWYHTRTEVGGNPFSSLGLDWCSRCKIEVDTDTEAHHQLDVHVYRRRCRRCGLTIKYGAYRTPLVGTALAKLPSKIYVWLHQPGKDRR